MYRARHSAGARGSISLLRALFFALAACLLFCAPPAEAGAKYVFLFIGDGMGPAQVNMAEAYIAGMRRAVGDVTPRESQMTMTSLPNAGWIKTDSLDGVTDSAAAATAIATGHKTRNKAIACDPKSGARWSSLVDDARARGMRTGIITSSFLQDATPAAFCAHAETRTSTYAIGTEMISSKVDLLGGGGFRRPKGKDGKQEDLYEAAARRGWTVAHDTASISAIRPGTRAIITHTKLSAGSMPFSIDDRSTGQRLSDFTRQAIRLLDGDAGFFLMVEGGRIDITCHANDAAGTVYEIADFDEAIRAAIEFAQSRPDETLIVVTADHETGGLSLASPLDPDRIYRGLSGQRGAHTAHEGTVSPKGQGQYAAYLARASDFFGTKLDDTPETKAAFKMSTIDKKSRPTKDKEYRRLYATYEPFTVACMHQANAKAGIKWERFYHTGKNVPIWAAGIGAEQFAGTYDNTEIRGKILNAMDR